MTVRTATSAIVAVFVFSSVGETQSVAAGNWAAVNSAIGRSGTIQPDGVMKYSFPRGDLDVTLNGVKIKPALALGSWVAFKRISGGRAMVMGDLVLTQDEISQ